VPVTYFTHSFTPRPTEKVAYSQGVPNGENSSGGNFKVSGDTGITDRQIQTSGITIFKHMPLTAVNYSEKCSLASSPSSVFSTCSAIKLLKTSGTHYYRLDVFLVSELMASMLALSFIHPPADTAGWKTAAFTTALQHQCSIYI